MYRFGFRDKGFEAAVFVRLGLGSGVGFSGFDNLKAAELSTLPSTTDALGS